VADPDLVMGGGLRHLEDHVRNKMLSILCERDGQTLFFEGIVLCTIVKLRLFSFYEEGNFSRPNRLDTTREISLRHDRQSSYFFVGAPITIFKIRHDIPGILENHLAISGLVKTQIPNDATFVF